MDWRAQHEANQRLADKARETGKTLCKCGCPEDVHPLETYEQEGFVAGPAGLLVPGTETVEERGACPCGGCARWRERAVLLRGSDGAVMLLD